MKLTCRNRVLDLGAPVVMGVLNVTPDSFSDGGRFFDVDAAVAHGLRMAEEGATLIDVGGESTRPGAAHVSPAEEIDRVAPVIERIAGRSPVLLSVDTSKPEVMSAAVSAGAHLINDVRGLRACGALEAAGEYRFIADADFSMPVEEIKRFLPPVCSAEIAIGSRETHGAVRYGEPAYRHLTGRVFNHLIRWMVLPGLQDTQCGFKCFRAEVAREIFPRQTLMGWAFDVELLAIARARGYRIVEVGIPWYFNSESKINVLRDSWRMFLDLLVIRRNLRRGSYHAG